MGMTMTQKILAAHAGFDSVQAGQLIEADLDLVLGNDITSPVAIHEIEKMKVDGVFHKDKIALVMDHFVPNKDIKSAQHCKCVREFACKNEITNYFDVGEMGIEHALLPEKGLTVAGDVIIGADSHTCTYGALGAFSTGVGSTDMAAGMATGKAWFKVPSAIKFNITGKPAPWISGKDVILHIIGMIGVDGALYKSMEFVGDGIQYLSMDDRFTIANMAIEAGGKNGIFPVDEKAEAYMKEHSKRPYKVYEADEDAVYDEEYIIDLSTLRPTVAFPHLPDLLLLRKWSALPAPFCRLRQPQPRRRRILQRTLSPRVPSVLLPSDAACAVPASSGYSCCRAYPCRPENRLSLPFYCILSVCYSSSMSI